MLETYLRTKYQKILVDPFTEFFSKFLSPNGATFLALIFGLFVAFALICRLPGLACIFLLISGYFDTLDGSLARFHGNTSIKGTVLDVLCDRIVEFGVILGLFSIDPLHRGWLALGMLGSILLCVTVFLLLGIFTKNASQKSFYYSPGLIERTEAFLFFIVMMLAPAYFMFLASLFIFLVLLTVYQHFVGLNKFSRSH